MKDYYKEVSAKESQYLKSKKYKKKNECTILKEY